MYDVKLPEPYTDLNDEQINKLVPLSVWRDARRGVYIKCLDCKWMLHMSTKILLARTSISPELTAQELDKQQRFRCRTCGTKNSHVFIERRSPPFN